MKRFTSFVFMLFMMTAFLLPATASAKEYYVCYKSRHDVRTQDRTSVAYVGCIKSHSPCARHNERYFGQYSTRSQAEAAYSRCVHNSPRHID